LKASARWLISWWVFCNSCSSPMSWLRDVSRSFWKSLNWSPAAFKSRMSLMVQSTAWISSLTENPGFDIVNAMSYITSHDQKHDGLENPFQLFDVDSMSRSSRGVVERESDREPGEGSQGGRAHSLAVHWALIMILLQACCGTAQMAQSRG
jgi:hypothetical protein